MHMPDVLQAEPPRVADAHRAGGPNATRDPARDETTGTETARNGSSFLAIIEEMLAGSMDGMDEIRQLSSRKTAEREAGGILAPGESDALKKLGAGGAHTARPGKSNPRFDADSARFGTNVSVRDGRTASGDTDALIAVAIDGKKGVAEFDPRYRPRIGEREGALESSVDGIESLRKGSKARANAAEGEFSETAAFTHDARFESVRFGADARKNGDSAYADSESGMDEPTAKVSGKNQARDRKAAIAVRDERSFADARERIAGENMADKAAGASLETETTETADGVADMSIGFRSERPSGGYGETQAALRADGVQAGEASFSTMLSQELREQAGEFVKAGKIVLRDGNSGTIRLTLHPESLGNVRISLELSSDKRISGKIQVASKEAYDAFFENLDGFSDAFVEGGFESAGFDLSWSGSGGYGKGDGTDARSAIAPYYASSVPDVMSGPNSSDRFVGGYRGYDMSAIYVFA